MTGVPLMRARPSLAFSSTRGMPALAMASAPGRTCPPNSASPSPIMGSTMWARGQRSPLAPTEPFSGMTGWTPRLSMAARVSGMTALAPEKPFRSEFRRSRRIPRTASRGRGVPTPTASARIRLTWRSEIWSSGIATSAKRPKPVLMPYMGRPSSSRRSTTARDAATFSRASPEISTGAFPRVTARKFSRVRLLPSRITVFFMSKSPFASFSACLPGTVRGTAGCPRH